MIQNQESFATVQPEILKKFEKGIIGRINHDQFIFDHLKISVSRVHSDFKPYNNLTFQLLQKMTTDLLNDPSNTHNDTLAHIFSTPKIYKNYF